MWQLIFFFLIKSNRYTLSCYGLHFILKLAANYYNIINIRKCTHTILCFTMLVYLHNACIIINIMGLQDFFFFFVMAGCLYFHYHLQKYCAGTLWPVSVCFVFELCHTNRVWGQLSSAPLIYATRAGAAHSGLFWHNFCSGHRCASSVKESTLMRGLLNGHLL